MTYQEELDSPASEKHAIVILKPRRRVTGWTSYNINTWVASFDYGPVSRVWTEWDGSDGLSLGASKDTLVDGEYYYDEANGLLYVFNGSTDPDSPISWTLPGLTVEYELYLATKEFMGPRNPLSSSSDPVTWRGVLAESPEAMTGSRQQLFGFNPLEESVLVIRNQDGWMNKHLYDSSFQFATIRSFVMIGHDIERAVELGYVKETFRGYGGAPKLNANGDVSIASFDFLSFLDRPANPPQRMNRTDFPSCEPNAVLSGKQWFIRRVRGMVDNFEPINIDYNATPSTTVNRDFLTHEGTGTEGTYGANVDDVATNAAGLNTRTYFTTTPKFNKGDAIILVHNGVSYYTIVSTVVRAQNYITHGAIVGRTVVNGDAATRYYIGWVKVQDSNGVWWNLFPGRDFTRINKATLGNTPDWLGFRLADNWEATIGFPETFDPAVNKVLCRVYGTETLDTYSDATSVGAVVDEGGIAAQSISLLHYLLRQAGIPNSMIDKDTFAAASTNHALGLAIPRNRADSEAPTYKDLIDLVLGSMLWKLIYVVSGQELKIGLIETGPFVASADYEADEQDFLDFEFEHDYSALYNRVVLEYGFKEMAREGDSDIFLTTFSPDGTQAVTSENRMAKDLHMTEQTFEREILQYIYTQAQIIADRYAFALGDRRAYYNLTLGPSFLEKAILGVSYQVIRKQLPGYEFDEDVERERQTMLIESTKSARGVNLTLEDQKGIQDNSGDW